MTQAGGPTIEPGSEGSRALAAGQAFGARYRIDRLIGKGGMGAVYEAWDAELEVKVALKVIHPDQLADPKRAQTLERRFKRELLLGRRVTHKNVVRIHDIGEIFGIKYITMPFIDGDDLSTVMKKAGGKLPVPRALAIARSALSGLVAAHDAGVVHRDLKPANIMIDADDQAYIMDFGIALATSSDTTESADGVTGTTGRSGTLESELLDSRTQLGRVVGTVQYMAPEQGRGDTVDQRADLYAFGLILYDMLVGKFRERTSSSSLNELTGRMKAAPPLVRSIEPDVPEALEEIINVCVQPGPEDRYQTSRELEAALDRLDDEGNLRPIARRVSPLQLSAAVAGVVALLGSIWWFTYTPPPVVQPDPVSVVIADLDNRTNDAAFDGTLEPMLKRVLEDAGFISAYDRTGVRILGVPLPDALDEVAARELAVDQGLGVVLSGSIDLQGSGYRISLKATQTVTGEVITSAEGRARSKDQVLDVATRLIARVRNALGDDTSESAQQFAMASLSATSLDVVGLYAAAMEAQSANRFDEAREHASRAVALDPDFGVGYLVLAAAAGNMGRMDDEREYVDEALRHLDGMTERERYSARGYSYFVTGDYEQCVRANSDRMSRYPGDVGGRNELALCLSHLRDMRRAMEEVQKIVEILPSHPIFRINLALYANYASDFQIAETAARQVEGPDAYATLALALAQMGQGQVIQARETYETLGQIEPLGASFAASGLGDPAVFEG
ncbi:MAG: protein kinase, partial [Acidobacteria bacterium]|nr:protein kinase [Acidobacteriota bacterium]